MDHADPEQEISSELLLYRIRRKDFGLSLKKCPQKSLQAHNSSLGIHSS